MQHSLARGLRLPLSAAPALQHLMPHVTTFLRAFGSQYQSSDSDQVIDKVDEVGLSFSDYKAIYEGRTTADLLRALTVLRLCAYPPFVERSEALLDTSRKLLGDNLTYSFVRDTFYKHFCAGENASDVWSRMNALRAHGIGAILDYAEEEDLLPHCRPEHEGKGPGAAALAAANKSGSHPALSRDVLAEESVVESGVVQRTYTYESEDACERHTQAFLAAIDTAATLPGQGFAAIKLTALGDPALLERLSGAVNRIRALFETFDDDGDGCIDRQEFERHCNELLGKGSTSTSDQRDSLFDWLDSAGQGKVDYVSWANRIQLQRVPAFAARAAAAAAKAPAAPAEAAGAATTALGSASLTPGEAEALQRLLSRLERLVDRATNKGVKLMIDAEHSLFQPAIDHLAHQLMREHNVAQGPTGHTEAVILLTYQAYRKDTVQRLERDLQRAQREGYTLGCKLVRGAYYHLERKHAEEMGVPCLVFDHIKETHAAFDACLDMMLAAAKEGRGEVMIGSHNQASVARTVFLMDRLGLQPDTAPVYFGQLLGMADHLSFPLGHNGYRVFKYVPYGRVDKVVPYLLRRANENQYILKGGKQDLSLLTKELARRLRDPQYSPLGGLLGGGSTESSSSATA